MKILVSSLVDLQKSAHNSRLHQFLNYLSQNHEVTVISINDWWKPKWDNSSEYNKSFLEIFQKIQFCYLTEKKISPLLQETVLPLFSKNLQNKLNFSDFDVHFNYNGFFLGYKISQIVDAYNILSVYDIADDLPEMIGLSPQIPKILRPFGKRLGKNIMYRNVNIAEKVTITTESIRNTYHLPKNKTILVPNGVDAKLFSPSDGIKLREKYNIENDFIIGFIGVLREWIDFNPLFSTIKKLDHTLNIKLLIVGGGNGYDETVKLVYRYKIQDKVIFTGTIPYIQVPEYISCMDVCIIPFKQDKVADNSLPLKLFEYMACEKPVITTPIDAIKKNFLRDVKFASDSNDYEEKILELYNDENARRELGSNGRKIVLEKYDWLNITQNLERILEEAISKV